MTPTNRIGTAFFGLVVTAFLAGSAACGSDNNAQPVAGTGGSGGQPADSAIDDADSGMSVKSAKSSLARDLNPSVSASDFQALLDGNAAFALDLYARLRSEPGNLMISPYSASIALAMTWAGARGTTEAQMASAMHFLLPQGTLHPAFDKLSLQLAALNTTADPATGKGFQLNVANSVWAAQSMTWHTEFLDTLALYYGAGIFLTDFVNSYEAARSDINTWVADETQQRIKDLLPPGSIASDTHMVLVNAVYFRASWNEPFVASLTQDMPFHALSGDVNVPMMRDTRPMLHGEGDGFQVGEIPYEGFGAVMTVVVPELGRYDEIEGMLTPAWLQAQVASMQSGEVNLYMPKFGFESGPLFLKTSLQAMGMNDPFKVSADFSGMTPDGTNIAEVIQKTFVAIDEKGTEAAAATAVIMAGSSAGGSGPPTVDLHLDRPFLFFIREKQTGTILFMGRYVGP
ncbi:MAG: serpin family protein [Deltaproteobacteria bacterium]|nr:serpin family protein [Deltaproteobacteria bacterium]